MHKVIITGGAGFIGSHLAEELVKQCDEVTVLDDLSSGKLENIEGIQKNIRFVNGSINDSSLLETLLKDIDIVFHLAAIPGVFRSVEDPYSSHDTNLTGTLNLLLAARNNKVKKVIYASSSSAYGDTPTLPKKEHMTPHPLSPYAVSKLAAEYYCLVFNTVYGANNVCLRYFNVYGPRQEPDSQYAAVIPLFINNIIAGSPPVIFGDGSQTRDFTYVKDVVKANILAAQNDACGVFNISRGEKITINKLAGLIGEIMNSKVEPIYKEARPGDVIHSMADITKAKEFGFKPEFDLKTGLMETIKWFHDQ